MLTRPRFVDAVAEKGVMRYVCFFLRAVVMFAAMYSTSVLEAFTVGVLKSIGFTPGYLSFNSCVMFHGMGWFPDSTDPRGRIAVYQFYSGVVIILCLST